MDKIIGKICKAKLCVVYLGPSQRDATRTTGLKNNWLNLVKDIEGTKRNVHLCQQVVYITPKTHSETRLTTILSRSQVRVGGFSWDTWFKWAILIRCKFKTDKLIRQLWCLREALSTLAPSSVSFSLRKHLSTDENTQDRIIWAPRWDLLLSLGYVKSAEIENSKAGLF